MGLIKKLLWRGCAGLGEIPVPQTEMVSKAEYDRVCKDVEKMDVEIFWLKQDVLFHESNLATARAEAAANAAELAQWRQYGQMRDPQTGRLVPRVKAEVV